MSRYLILLVLTALLGMPRLSVADPANAPLTPEQVARDVAVLKDAYARIHPGYTRYTDVESLDSAWQGVVDAAQSQDGLSVGDFYLAVQRVLTLIRCDHTKAELPAALKKYRREAPVYLPFQWILLEGRGFVTVSAENSGITPGDEIISIDGRPLAELVAQVEVFIPFDGRTEWARRAGVSNSREFMGGALDHFGDLLWDNDTVVNLVLANERGVTRSVTADRIPFDAWRKLDANTGPAPNFVDAVHFEPIGENAGYLRVDTFVNYRRPVDPDSLYARIFKRLAEEDRDTLILDLRNNGGGSNDASSRLFAHLLSTPTRMKSDVRVKTFDLNGLRPYLETWEPRALHPDPQMFSQNDDGSYSILPEFTTETDLISPAKNAFTGRLLILTSDKNASGSTNVLAVLAGLGRATLIGERTGGSAEGTTAGILFTLNLPESGIRARLPLIRDYNNVPEFELGMGVNPDIPVAMTVEAWRAGSDPALETAIELTRTPHPQPPRAARRVP